MKTKQKQIFKFLHVSLFLETFEVNKNIQEPTTILDKHIIIPFVQLLHNFDNNLYRLA